MDHWAREQQQDGNAPDSEDDLTMPITLHQPTRTLLAYAIKVALRTMYRSH